MIHRILLALLLLPACADKDDPATGDTEPVDDTEPADDTDVADDTDTTVDTDETDPPVDESDLPEPAELPLDGPCTDANRVGRFVVESNEDYAYASGSVAEGVLPVAVLTLVAQAGECTIWRRENPFCNPNCEPGFTCDLSGTCVPYPSNVSVGDVTIRGLERTIVMSPVVPGNNYFNTTLSNPPWTPGQPIQLRTAGGDTWPEMTLFGVSPPQLEPATLAWLVTSGEPLVLQWDPQPEAHTEIVARLRIDQHGFTPSNIECIFTDDGEAEIPNALIDQLVALGLTGFPAGELFRRSMDSVEVEPGACIEFTPVSSRLPTVGVAGYTPCTADPQCPPGQICNEPLERCEPAP